ncbi:MAG: antibiotic biosynthesis monooxygenase [Sneathiella sp.]|nr:MAG: antibiotic biosynthesis monooxygenase [Sneathiella sp.]
MNDFAVSVNFDVKSGQELAFMEEMKKQAKNSLTLEPDCHYFDICVSPDDPGVVLLYELYTDAAAFDAHLASDHFVQFNETVAPMIAQRVITTWKKI